MGRKAKWKMENLRFRTKEKPVSHLIYHRAQKLIDLAGEAGCPLGRKNPRPPDIGEGGGKGSLSGPIYRGYIG